MVAPRDRRTQGLMAGRPIAYSAGQYIESMLQTCQQGLRRKQPDASGCQLDRQGKSVQVNTHFRNGTSVGLRQLKIRLDGLRTLHKEG